MIFYHILVRFQSKMQIYMLVFENFKSPNTNHPPKHDANHSVPHMQLNVFPLHRKAFILIETKKRGEKQTQ